MDDLIKNEVIPEYFNTPLVGSWEITRACNLRCIHCYNSSAKKLPNELMHDQKISVAHQIAEAKIFRMCLSGGEPILCKSFWEIARILKEGHVLCNTITNGWFVNRDTADKYSKYFNIIQVSIDGAKPETHDKMRGRKNSWEKAVNACKLIVENNGRIAISAVVSPINVNEIGELIDLAYKLGAQEFRTDEARLLGRAAVNRDRLVFSKKQSKKFEKIIIDKKKEYEGKKMRIEVANKNLGTYSASFSDLPPMVCYISPSGTCAPDPAIPFSGGSLKEKTLKEIWNDLKKCHKNPDFTSLSRFLKTGKDFVKLEEIPYVKGELHDK